MQMSDERSIFLESELIFFLPCYRYFVIDLFLSCYEKRWQLICQFPNRSVESKEVFTYLLSSNQISVKLLGIESRI
jgi:hypothetical protein